MMLTVQVKMLLLLGGLERVQWNTIKNVNDSDTETGLI